MQFIFQFLRTSCSTQCCCTCRSQKKRTRRSYSCDDCERSFTKKQYLGDHRRREHDNELLHCEECHEDFANTEQFKCDGMQHRMRESVFLFPKEVVSQHRYQKILKRMVKSDANDQKTVEAATDQHESFEWFHKWKQCTKCAPKGLSMSDQDKLLRYGRDAVPREDIHEFCKDKLQEIASIFNFKNPLEDYRKWLNPDATRRPAPLPPSCSSSSASCCSSSLAS